MTLAWDQSQRRKDEDGRLHIAWTPISKSMVCPYWGREIPNFETLGLQPDCVYHLWRHPEELAKAADTFNNIQVMSEHIAVSADSPNEKHVAGSLGTDCEFRPPYLGNSMVIYRAEDIAAIESNAKRQISAGYYYRADMTPGDYQGLHYDGIMRDIRANHVALVEAGRAGPDVLVTDSGETTMSKPLTSRKALLVKGCLAALLRPNLLPGTTLALDGALGGVNRINWQTEKPKVLAAVLEFAAPKLAKDQTLDAIKAGLKQALDSMDDEDDGEADDDEITASDEDDETEAEKEARMAKEKAAKDKRAKDAKAAKDAKTARDAKRAARDARRAAGDADPDDDDDDDDEPAKKEAKDKEAMDAAIETATAGVIARMNAAVEAREIVRPIVGQVALALDSAEAIYKFALDAHKIDLKGVDPSAFKAMARMLPRPGVERPAMAHDAAPGAALHSRFPGLARIGHA